MIKITADSTCDLSPDIIEKYDITITPLKIISDGKTYLDGIDIIPADIFRFVGEENKLCTTSAVNVYEYAEVFKEFSEKYEAIIHISLSSKISSSHQNAVVAASEFNNVYVIDSKNLSTGSGHIVLDAAILAEQGETPLEIVKKLNEVVEKVEASFVIDRLDYLHKGGRCSGVAAIGAQLLKIKPCIEVVDGEMKVGKKYRGDITKALENYVAERLSERDDIDYSRIFITHTPCDDGTVELVIETIKKFADFDEIIETNAGCTISNHCGPKTLGILFKRK